MRLRDGVSEAFGVVAIAIAIFAIGGRTWWSQLLVALAVGGALVPVVTSRRVFSRWSPLVVLGTLASVFCALQLIPLPNTIIAALDPTNFALRNDGAAIAGFSPGHTITLDAPGTFAALVFFLTLSGLAIVALRSSTSENGRYRIISAVAALCGLCAVVADVHRLLDVQALYGVITDTNGPPLLSPLLNGNQTACLMAIGAVLSIGLVMYPRQRIGMRAAWLVCGLTCVVACLTTLSRGGALALAAGGAVTVAVLVAQRFVATETRRHASFLSSSLPIGVIAVCAVVVVLYASAGGVKEQFTHTSFDELEAPRSKFEAWRSAGELIDESPWVGIGRGAFEPVFQRVHAPSAFATYTHLENEYLQAVVDWGVPGALILAFAAIWLVIGALRRWRDGPLAAGALGALAAVVLQSNVDFGIEFLGLAAPITALAATLVHVPLRETSPRRLAATRVMRIGHVALLGIGAVLLGTSVVTSIADDHLALEADPARALEDVSRHPFDYYGYARIAETMFRHGDSNAVRLLHHALTLHPTDPGLHIAAARMLYAAKHPDQAAIEYAAALPAARDHRRLLAEIAQRLPPDLAATAIPADPVWLDTWLRTLDDLHRNDVAIAWLERFVLLRRHAIHACERLNALAIQRSDLGAIEHLEHSCVDYQPSEEDRIALARLLHTRRSDAAVVSLLADVETWQGRNDLKVEAWLLLCEARMAIPELDDAKRCLRRLDGTGLVPAELASRVTDGLERIQDAERSAGSGERR